MSPMRIRTETDAVAHCNATVFLAVQVTTSPLAHLKKESSTGNLWFVASPTQVSTEVRTFWLDSFIKIAQSSLQSHPTAKLFLQDYTYVPKALSGRTVKRYLHALLQVVTLESHSLAARGSSTLRAFHKIRHQSSLCNQPRPNPAVGKL